MEEREPFLKAIFADPDSDLPRLAFADWLDDRGQADWAEFIRVQCEIARRGGDVPAELAAREAELVARLPGQNPRHWRRGLASGGGSHATAAELADPGGFRYMACYRNHSFYGATDFCLIGGTVTTPAQLDTLLNSPVTERVTEVLLTGRTVETGREFDPATGLTLTDFRYDPAITTPMVEHLCGMREARRLEVLDLSRNDLGNDALLAVARSPHLHRLRELHLSDGNPRFKGRVWSRVVERFGPEVVR